jgi:hypothetical protein
MKQILSSKKSAGYWFVSIICCAVCVLYISCNDIYDNIIDEFSVKEIVYPAHFDTIYGSIGYERVEIDLSKAGRIPSSKMKLGKATKTIVEYDGKEIVFDSVCSWVNITELTLPNLYRFKVYSADDFNNRSIPVEIALTPFTAIDTTTLAVPNPNIAASSSAAVIDWPNLNSSMMEYCGLSYSYTDEEGTVKTGERWKSSQFFVSNLEVGKKTTIQVRYTVIPKVADKPILDTVQFSQPVELTLPDASVPFYPSERDILNANGVTVFTADGTAGIAKLSYPILTTSLLDIFYFPDLKEVDLTGGNIPIPSLTYNRNYVISTVGGGIWSPCMQKIKNTSIGGVDMLINLMESGSIEKVLYAPHSMGLDSILAPYVEQGIVELVSPDEVLIPHQFNLDGTVDASTLTVDIAYPATDAPDAAGLDEIYKVTVRQRSSSLIFALPTEYRYNVEEYRYLKLKVYAPAKSAFPSAYATYQRLWFRFMNRLWNFSQYGYPGAGQGLWDTVKGDKNKIPDDKLQTWTDITVDLSNALLENRYNRVILINIGEEANPSPWNPPVIQYYFANIRLSKIP